MEPQPIAKFVFPKIKTVFIKNLSIYSRRSEISLEFADGVFCLAGANGLGKSTFISALNFGMTGRVPAPNRAFRSIEEYYDSTEQFSKEYFNGRVHENDRETAEIELTFDVGEHTYRIARGLFEPGALRRFEILGEDGLFDQEDLVMSPEKLQDPYAERLAQDMRLSNFQQFVFLHHFLLTFDESRTLIFWNSAALQAILFLAFGTGPELTQMAENERRAAERLDSNARNANYQASETQKRLRSAELNLQRQHSVESDITVEYGQLEQKRDEFVKQIQSKESELKDCRLRIGSAGAEIANLRRRYEEVFADRAVQQHGIENHPLIVRSLAESRCNLCGSSEYLDELKARIQKETCPLCGNVRHHERASQENLAALKTIDTQLQERQNGLDNDNLTLRRFEQELGVLSYQFQDVSTQITEMESNNVSLLVENRSPSDVGNLPSLVATRSAEVQELYRLRDSYREQRDQHNRTFRDLRDKIAQGYTSAQLEFVPMFRNLAHEFLGLDIDVTMDLTAERISLILQLEGNARRETHQLSESQRFFVDIALRMALGNFMAHSSAPVTMYIDTPEGSLDIAYESRAGQMFAQFVANGSHIVMTANINTSQLLRRLANICGSSKMQLERMTEWTQLSDVQSEEEQLFDDAYKAIEAELAGHS